MRASASPRSRGGASARRCAACAASRCTRSAPPEAGVEQTLDDLRRLIRTLEPAALMPLDDASVLLSGALEGVTIAGPSGQADRVRARQGAPGRGRARSRPARPANGDRDVGGGARGEGVPGVREAGTSAVRGERPAHATDGQRRRRRRGAAARRRRGMASAAPRPAAARRSRRGRLRDRREGRRHGPQRAPPRADAEPAGLGLVRLRVDRRSTRSWSARSSASSRRSTGRACSWSSFSETRRVEPGSWS